VAEVEKIKADDDDREIRAVRENITGGSRLSG
jgi:hypothetical protein